MPYLKSKPIFELAMVHQHVFEMWLATLSERMGGEIDRKQLKKSCSTLRVSALQDINRATLRGQNNVPQSLRKSSVVTIRADVSKLRPSLHITPAPKQHHTKASRTSCISPLFRHWCLFDVCVWQARNIDTIARHDALPRRRSSRRRQRHRRRRRDEEKRKKPVICRNGQPAQCILLVVLSKQNCFVFF